VIFMVYNMFTWVSLALALAVALSVSPADAQGRGKGQQKKAKPAAAQELRDRPELRRREYDDRWDDWWNDGRVAGREQGPPFCQNGQGHPVHGRQWCVQRGFRLGTGARYEDRVYDDRVSDRRDRRGGGSYEQAHDEFHRVHDRQCRLRAAERPLDPAWQIRVRSECRQIHDDWHRRAGRSHGD
jgi:hypothetical protein